jgi:type III pantothenate kinase
MILLVDAGNTRIKWRIVAQRTLLVSGSLATADCRIGQVAELESYWAASGLKRAVLSCVADAAVQAGLDALLARLGVARHWLKPERLNFGLHNLYVAPEQLGADRYAALIAASRLKLGHCVVICAGTATTVDMLSKNNEFLGGVIIPGSELMRAALLQGTRQIENRMRVTAEEALDFQAWPRDTDQAVRLGIGLAQAGTVRAMCDRLPRLPGEPVWLVLTGGARAMLRDGLTWQVNGGVQVQLVEIEDLVLEGLAWVALTLESTQFEGGNPI